jgi:beta-glucosidase
MKRLFLSLLLVVCCGSAQAQDAAPPLFRDPSQPIEKRIADLIGRLTLKEKAAQLN